MSELVGKILGGRYRVDAFLGRGGMADVLAQPAAPRCCG